MTILAGFSPHRWEVTTTTIKAVTNHNSRVQRSLHAIILLDLHAHMHRDLDEPMKINILHQWTSTDSLITGHFSTSLNTTTQDNLVRTLSLCHMASKTIHNTLHHTIFKKYNYTILYKLYFLKLMDIKVAELMHGVLVCYVSLANQISLHCHHRD